MLAAMVGGRIKRNVRVFVLSVLCREICCRQHICIIVAVIAMYGVVELVRHMMRRLGVYINVRRKSKDWIGSAYFTRRASEMGHSFECSYGSMQIDVLNNTRGVALWVRRYSSVMNYEGDRLECEFVYRQ